MDYMLQFICWSRHPGRWSREVTEALIPELVGLPHFINSRCVLNGHYLWPAHFSKEGRNTP